SGGTTLNVMPGTSFTSNEHLNLQNGGALDNQGTVILKKNLSNLNPGTNSLGSGNVTFSGTASQDLSGQNVIQNMTVNNATGLSLSGNTRVNGILALTSGRVSLGSNNLMLGGGATVSGTPSAGNMVVATGTGQLEKEFTAAGNFLFPVGDATGTSEYSPVALAFNSGTFGAGSYAGVNLTNAQYPGTTTSFLNRYWNVTQSGITGFSCNTTFQYPVADVVGTESDIFTFKVDPSQPWTAYNESNTVTHQLTAHGLSAFGTFTGNLGNAASPPEVRSLQDKNIASGMVTCADAMRTLLIAGNGTTYEVELGGSVTHIAGQRITYYPGTKVFAGGYLHGYISSTFCNPYIHPGDAPVVADNGEQLDPFRPDNSFVRIYPNPTTGNFTLELKGEATSSQVHIEIFGILGDKILSKDMLIEQKQEFSLTDKPVGVYVVHVRSGLDSETQKIINR
ncbi:MAG: T9SS type A sorting domain-containing protein, partial [Bacteroidota bacterium]